jgi:hypothetical protein
MKNLPISEPITPYDFMAVFETFRDRLDQLDTCDLGIFYGLYRLEPFRDEAICREIEDFVAENPEPVRARFLLAYELASSFWETFSMWQKRRIDGADGTYREKIQPDEPGYVGVFPESLREDIMAWLLASVAVYREDDELMRCIFWLKTRLEMWDTSLTRDEIQVLEKAMGETIDIRKDKHAQALIKRVFEKQRQKTEQDMDDQA